MKYPILDEKKTDLMARSTKNVEQWYIAAFFAATAISANFASYPHRFFSANNMQAQKCSGAAPEES